MAHLNHSKTFSPTSPSSLAGRFIYHALATVVHQRLVIQNWNDNDYAYIAVLARGLESEMGCGQRPPLDEGDAQAVEVYMDYDSARTRTTKLMRVTIMRCSPRNVLSALSSADHLTTSYHFLHTYCSARVLGKID